MRLKKIILMAVLTTCTLVFSFAGEFKMFNTGMEYVYAETEGDYEYTIDSNTATITKYNGSATELIIPSTLGGKTVTAIGTSAFRGNTSLVTVEIPNSVVTIESHGLRECTNLTNVKLSSKLTKIGAYAFDNANIQSITLNDNLIEIGVGAFQNCKKLESIEIPANVTTLGSYAFYNCNKLKSVTFSENCKITEIVSCTFQDTALESIIVPDSVTKILDYAFDNCSSLKEVTLSKNLKEFYQPAFTDCGNIEKITIEGHEKYKSVNNGLIDTTNNELVWACKTTVIPDYVTRIGSRAYKECTGITEFVIPSQITYIGDYAFEGVGVTEIVIPETVEEAGKYAFCRCPNLTTVKIEAQLETLSQNMFSNNKKLVDIEIPDSVKSIGGSAFNGCEALTSIDLPEKVESIGGQAFEFCSKLNDIELPNTVTSIGENAFSSCIALESITIPNGVSILENNTFSYCSELTEVTIPNGLISINEGVFEGCEKLTGIELPNSITGIGKSAFKRCEALESINIPDGVESIGENTFYWCESLKSIELPKSLKSISNGAFYGCKGLESIEIPSGVTNMEYYAFGECSNLKLVKIPSSVTHIEHAFDYSDNVVIVCEYGSYAHTYAQENNIDFSIILNDDNTSVTVADDEYTYTGAEIKPKVTVKFQDVVLVQGTDYEVEYSDNVNIGTAKVTINGMNGYYGTFERIFDINVATITDVALDTTEYIYDGSTKTPSVVVKSGETTLVAGIDYEVTYSNNVNVGTATVMVTGKGNYVGTVEKIFEIKPATLTEVTLEIEEYVYDGTAKTPSVVVKSGETTLVAGTDYEVTYSNNVNVGTAIVTVTGKGKYTGVVEKTFTIKLEETSEKEPTDTPKDNPEKDPNEKSEADTEPGKVVSLKQKASYSTSSIQISGKEVEDSTKYQVYVSTSKKGKYKLVATTEKTSYKHTGLGAGKTYYYKVRAYKLVDDAKIYGEYSSVVKGITKTKKATIKVQRSGTGKVKLTWKKVTGAEGYEIYMKTGKNGKYKKVKSLSGKVTYTVSKLKIGKKYYFKVRTYRKAGKTKVYSDWSNVKNLTVK